MSTLLSFRPTQSRQNTGWHGLMYEGRVPVEAMVGMGLQPLFAQHSELKNLEFRLIDPTRADGLLGDDLLSVAANELAFRSGSGNATVHPAEARGHSVQLFEPTNPEAAVEEIEPSHGGAPVIQFRPRAKPVFDPQDPPPTAA